MKPIEPIGKSDIESFITKIAQRILETQDPIETSDFPTEEFSMPASRVAGLTELLGENKYIRPTDATKAGHLVVINNTIVN